MKRSKINQLMREADAFVKEHRFYLPPFAYWTPDDWHSKGPEVREIVENGLGWDITDFGQGDYDRFGLLLFTIRNGNKANLNDCRGKIYAEKILLVGDQQMTPFHFHWDKTEDIINRGGGKLMLQLYNSTAEEGLAETDIHVSLDGVERVFKPGETVCLEHGESITLTTGLYHNFWGEGGMVLAGEVSMVNDDHNDNRFYEPVGRFSEIEEDEPILYPLIGDYATLWTADSA